MHPCSTPACCVGKETESTACKPQMGSNFVTGGARILVLRSGSAEGRAPDAGVRCLLPGRSTDAAADRQRGERPAAVHADRCEPGPSERRPGPLCGRRLRTGSPPAGQAVSQARARSDAACFLPSRDTRRCLLVQPDWTLNVKEVARSSSGSVIGVLSTWPGTS